MRSRDSILLVAMLVLLAAWGPRLGLIGYPPQELVSALALCAGALLVRRRRASTTLLGLAQALYEARRQEVVRQLGSAAAASWPAWEALPLGAQEACLRQARTLLLSFHVLPR